METNWQLVALLGFIGGVLPDLLKAMRKRFHKRPAYFGKLWYWGMLALLGGLGALVAALRNPSDALEALAYGIAAPAFVTQFIAADEDPHLGDTGADHPNAFQRMRRWWGS